MPDITKAFPIGMKMKAKVRDEASSDSGEMSIWEMEIINSKCEDSDTSSGVIIATIKLMVITVIGEGQ